MTADRVSQPKVVIRYHSERMLATLDLTTLVSILIEEYGAPLELRFEPMDTAETDVVTEDMGGITAVRQRFWILEGDACTSARRRDLEKRAVHEGQK